MNDALEVRAAATGRRRTEVEPSLSVVVPVLEPTDDLKELYFEYSAPLRARELRFEFLFVARRGCEAALRPLSELVQAGEPIAILEAGQSLTEGPLLRAGGAHARAPVIVSLPPYRRVVADALPVLAQRVAEGLDVAMARRWPRQDSWVNRLQSRAFNLLLGGVTGARVRDVACGVAALRKEVLQELPLHGDFFRFLPVLALREGFRVEEVPARQHPQDVRTRLHGPGVYLRRAVDVLGLFFLLRFTEKPLRFFGLVGSVLLLVGGLLLAMLVIQRLGGEPLADRPPLLVAMLLIVTGIQAVALGLVGEIIVHYGAPGRRPYRLAREEDAAGPDPPPP